MEKSSSQAIAERIISLLTSYALSLNSNENAAVVDKKFVNEQMLYNIIHHRFIRENDMSALRILENFRNDPEEYQINLKNKLIGKYLSDPGFARELDNVLQQFPTQEILVRNRSLAQGNKMCNSLGRGTQRIDVDHNSQANNNSMEIS